MTVELFQSETSAAAKLWRDYIGLEDAGRRAPAAAALQRFIAALKAEGEADEFAERVCRLLLDGESGTIKNYFPYPVDNREGGPQGIRIRHPLFRDVLLPFLTRRFARQRSPYGRWLAAFEQYFYSDPSLAKAVGLDVFDPANLLRLDVAENPRDRAAAEALARLLGRRIDHAFHEVPHGVLLDPDTADGLLDELDRVAQMAGQSSHWAAPLAHWRQVNQAWASYRIDHAGFGSFAEYLQSRIPGAGR